MTGEVIALFGLNLHFAGAKMGIGLFLCDLCGKCMGI